MNQLKEVLKTRRCFLSFSDGKFHLARWEGGGMLSRLVLQTFDSDIDLTALLERQ